MMEIIVDVILDNVSINLGGSADGLAVPVQSFKIGGVDYSVNANGTLIPEYVGGAPGPDKKLIGSDEYEWNISNDDNHELVPVRGNYVPGTPRTFFMMMYGSNIFLIGITANGSFEPFEITN